MSIFTEQSGGYTVLDLGFDKSLTRSLSLQQGGSGDVPPELINAFSEGTAPRTLISGELISSLEQQTGVVFSGKTDFDNTQVGYRLGIDTDDIVKFYIGSTTDYLNWDGSTLTITGALQASSIDIPDTTTANSFHVDVDGNTWWGATTFASAVASISAAGDAIFNSVTIPGVAKFGGTGADGALSITSGTTTINAGGAAILVKNYTSISITGTGALAFSNPHTNGTIVILRSQGSVTLTSSANPNISTVSMGSAAAPQTTTTTNGGQQSSNAIGNVVTATGGITGKNNTSGNTGGAGGTGPLLSYSSIIVLGTAIAPGGGGGAGGCDGSAQDKGGAGGIGGGGLYIECNGTWTRSGNISAAGTAGSAAEARGGSSQGAGGGGGGGGGSVLVLYRTLGSEAGSITVSGGSGGAGINSHPDNTGAGGGGAGMSTNGSAGGDNGGTGGTGGNGTSLVAANTVFA